MCSSSDYSHICVTAFSNPVYLLVSISRVSVSPCFRVSVSPSLVSTCPQIHASTCICDYVSPRLRFSVYSFCRASMSLNLRVSMQMSACIPVALISLYPYIRVRVSRIYVSMSTRVSEYMCPHVSVAPYICVFAFSCLCGCLFRDPCPVYMCPFASMSTSRYVFFPP